MGVYGRIYEGTHAAMLLITDAPVGTEYIVTSGTNVGDKYEYRGATAGWVKTHDVNGAALVSDASPKTVIYTGTTYKYFCAAVPGSALTSNVWLIERLSIATGNRDHADGNINFDNVATSLVIVEALTFG